MCVEDTIKHHFKGGYYRRFASFVDMSSEKKNSPARQSLSVFFEAAQLEQPGVSGMERRPYLDCWRAPGDPGWAAWSGGRWARWVHCPGRWPTAAALSASSLCSRPAPGPCWPPRWEEGGPLKKTTTTEKWTSVRWRIEILDRWRKYNP